MKVVISLMGENDEPSIEPLLAYNMPLTTWEKASFSLERVEVGALCGHTGLGEQGVCWILAPSPALSPAHTLQAQSTWASARMLLI